MKPLFMVGVFIAMQLEPTPLGPVGSEDFIRHALTQGGLLALLMFVGWSYRRDFMRQADEKAERIHILTELVGKSTEAQTRSSEALIQCTAALNTQAHSIQAMSQALGELKGAMTGRRGTDHP